MGFHRFRCLGWSGLPDVKGRTYVLMHDQSTSCTCRSAADPARGGRQCVSGRAGRTPVLAAGPSGPGSTAPARSTATSTRSRSPTSPAASRAWPTSSPPHPTGPTKLAGAPVATARRWRCTRWSPATALTGLVAAPGCWSPSTLIATPVCSTTGADNGPSLPPSWHGCWRCRRFAPSSPPGGIPLKVGRTRRYATQAQRDAAFALWGSCAWPGCEAPPLACDLHHVHDFERGGRTDDDNLVPLCGIHHHAITHGRTSPAACWSVMPASWQDRRACAILRPTGNDAPGP